MNGIALYRLPGEKSMVQITGDFILKNISENREQGFVISNFEGDKFALLRAYNVKRINAVNEIELPFEFLPKIKIFNNNYENALKSAIQKVNANELQKVVIAKNEIHLFSPANTISVFQKICDHFSNAFCFLFNSPFDGSYWIGASPELLLSKDNDKMLTMALAGTKVSDDQIAICDWNQKEIQEHKFVADYISEKLNSKNIIFEKTSTEVLKSGKLNHLVNYFAIDKNTSMFDLAKLIHPTPAVCGIPFNLAKEFILKHEEFDRELYSGYCGVLNIENTNAFYVTLRCAKITNEHITFYAGGGINKGSNFEKEKNESNAKIENLKNLVFKN